MHPNATVPVNNRQKQGEVDGLRDARAVGQWFTALAFLELHVSSYVKEARRGFPPELPTACPDCTFLYVSRSRVNQKI
jgi:hypothetical protein